MKNRLKKFLFALVTVAASYGIGIVLNLLVGLPYLLLLYAGIIAGLYLIIESFTNKKFAAAFAIILFIALIYQWRVEIRGYGDTAWQWLKNHSVESVDDRQKDNKKSSQKESTSDSWKLIDRKIITYGPDDVINTGLPVLPGDSIIYSNPTVPLQIKMTGELTTFTTTVRNVSKDKGTPYVRGAGKIALEKIGEVEVIIKRKEKA